MRHLLLCRMHRRTAQRRRNDTTVRPQHLRDMNPARKENYGN